MDDLIVMQFNANKISAKQARVIFDKAKNDLQANFKEPPTLVAILDGMSIMSYSLDELKAYYSKLGKMIEALEKNQEEEPW